MRGIDEKKYTPLEIAPIVDMARNNPQELVRRSEEYYNEQVMAAARQIQANPRFRFVLLCGPTASGKTTTAHKLKHRLINLGVSAEVISMDDFFKGVEYYPKLPDGKPDMESFQDVDHEYLNECFERLLETGSAEFPIFDFAKQRRSENVNKISLGNGGVIIMEGIHALNPAVLSNISRENIFRIYVSVRSKFVNGEESVLVPKDIRLIRRMVRDNNFRSWPPLATLSAWGYVIAAERVNIDLYRDDVNIKIDNTIDYEVCIWQNTLHDLLSSTMAGSGYEAYPEIQRIFAGLEHFPPIDYKLMPKNSLLREFVGNKI